jgi:DNA-binding CsgD family transcriptional regulator
MQSHWILGPKPLPGLTVSLTQAAALMQQLGMGHQHAVAEGLLNLLGEHVALAQCTIFAYEGMRAPRIVAVGDRSRTQALADIAEAYVTRFYQLDGCMTAMREELSAARKAGMLHPRIVMHRQTGADIAHDEYRHICYERPQVAERLALLALYEGRRWLSVNLYRGIEHGTFDAAAIDVVSAFAPLIVHAVRLHHTGQSVNQELGDLLLARLRARHPQLTPRDCDVVRSLLDGQSTAAMAERLGLTLASARTYVKRVYRKLGVSGQRDMMGMLLEPGLKA